jgi:hypothetical protein
MSKLRASAPVFVFAAPVAVANAVGDDEVDADVDVDVDVDVDDDEEAYDDDVATTVVDSSELATTFADVALKADLLRHVLRFLSPPDIHRFACVCTAFTWNAHQQLLASIPALCDSCRLMVPADVSARIDRPTALVPCYVCRAVRVAVRGTLFACGSRQMPATRDLARTWFECTDEFSELAAIRTAEVALTSAERRALIETQLRAHAIPPPQTSSLMRSYLYNQNRDTAKLFAGYLGCLFKLNAFCFDESPQVYSKFHKKLQDDLLIRLFYHRRAIQYGQLPDWAALAQAVISGHGTEIEFFQLERSLRHSMFGFPGTAGMHMADDDNDSDYDYDFGM